MLWRQISPLAANCTVQKVKFSGKDSFSKYKQICSFLRIFSCWFHCMKSVRIRSFLVRIFPQETLHISPYSVQMWENIYQKNSEYGFFHAMLKKYLKEKLIFCVKLKAVWNILLQMFRTSTVHLFNKASILPRKIFFTTNAIVSLRESETTDHARSA